MRGKLTMGATVAAVLAIGWFTAGAGFTVSTASVTCTREAPS